MIIRNRTWHIFLEGLPTPLPHILMFLIFEYYPLKQKRKKLALFTDFYILHALLPQSTPPSLNGIKVFKGLIQREMEFDVSTTACTEIERKVNYGMFFYAMFF